MNRALLLALGCAALTGCSTPKGTVVQDQPPQAERFWVAIKDGPDELKSFLASDAAKKNAPLFFRIAWRLSFSGYAAAGGEVGPLARGVVAPTCSVIASAASASGLTTAQVADIVSRLGADWDDERYAPMAEVMLPLLSAFVGSLEGDAALACYYLRAAAQAGKDACQPYL